MKQSRIAKSLARKAVVSWRDEPTQLDIEARRANLERVRRVIRARWMIVAVLAVFSVAGATIYGLRVPFHEFVSNMFIPAFALLLVLLYNTFYQVTLPRVGNIAFLNTAQLTLDALVVTVLVHYSGGVYSWFEAMYLLFIVEAAFILPRNRDVWLIVGVCALAYGAVLGSEYWGLLPHVHMAFVANNLYHDPTYVMVRYLWDVTVYIGAGAIGIMMMSRIHAREAELQEGSFIDEMTQLYNRQYLMRILSAETARARRGGWPVGLVLIDVYRFGDFNRTFGSDEGDEMLTAVAERLREVAHAAAESGYDANAACRVAGEELAIVMPGIVPGGDVERARARLLDIGEQVRCAVEELRVHGLGVTVSVGLALAPRDGDTVEALMDAADEALIAAADAGGNTVRGAWTLRGAEEADA